MLSSIYTGLSGLLAFSKGLDVLSNNITNLNTPGFKGSELAFRDAFYQNAERQGTNQANLQIGQGVDTGTTHVKYGQGELRETGNPLDVAIDGNGFFVVRRDGELLYTRAGQFEFDGDGFLVERTSRARATALTGGNQLVDININGRRVSAPQPTSRVTLSGNLSSGGSTHSLSEVTVFDGAGVSRTLALNFTNNNAVTAGSWLVEVRDTNGAVIANGEIRYRPNGSPESEFNTLQFAFAPGSAPETMITLDFGDPGSFSNSTNFSGGMTSDLQVRNQDGRPNGSLIETTVNERGELTVSYSNGQTEAFERLVLAQFSSPQDLNAVGGGFFQNTTDQAVVYGSPDTDGLGKTLASRVELSNVELTEQFTDLVVLQRGYQASSQIISVTNEMIQQLMDIRNRR